jgi:cofilin
MAEGKKEFRYIIFKIQDKEITVEKAVGIDQMGSAAGADDYTDNSKTAYEEFVQDLKNTTNDLKECRYAVFDFKFTGSREGAGASKMDKIIFLQVCPDGASVKQKMVYASSAQAIKQALNQGKFIALQISDESEMSHREIFNKLSDKYSDKRA